MKEQNKPSKYTDAELAAFSREVRRAQGRPEADTEAEPPVFTEEDPFEGKATP